MTTFTLTVTDEKRARFEAAVDAIHPKDEDSPLTDAQHYKKMICFVIAEFVRDAEHKIAQTAINVQTDNDFMTVE